MKMRKPSLNPSWPLVLIGTCSALLGAILSATLVMLNHVDFVHQSERNVAKLRNKISILEIALNQAQPYTTNLEDEKPVISQPEVVSQTIQPEVVTSAKPAPPQQTLQTEVQVAKPSVPQRPATKTDPPQAAPKPPPVAHAVAKAAPKIAQPQVASAKPSQAAPTSTPAPSVSQPKTQPVTPEELAAASAKKIEVLTMARVGVAKLHPNEVEFTSGRRVRIGELFPSGEKLLKLDPVDGRIVTNERQLIVFDQ